MSDTEKREEKGKGGGEVTGKGAGQGGGRKSRRKGDRTRRNSNSNSSSSSSRSRSRSRSSSSDNHAKDNNKKRSYRKNKEKGEKKVKGNERGKSKEKDSSSSSENEARETSAKKVTIINNNNKNNKVKTTTSSDTRPSRTGSGSPQRIYGSRNSAGTSRNYNNSYSNNHRSGGGSNNANNTTNSSSRSSDGRRRPATSHARLESGTTTSSSNSATAVYSPRGYDNSERNPDRINLGSSTDQVAGQRPIFGAWHKPDPEKQRQLVERLAPAKAPAPQDPKFNHWKNHFRYYWFIGVDEKPRRPGIYGDAPMSPRRTANYNRYNDNNNNNNQRLLNRPKTTAGRTVNNSTSSNSSSSDSNASGGDMKNTNNLNDSVYGKPSRGSQSAREWGSSDSSRVVSGLDRRYMGLQAVSNAEMQEIVNRLTKMTSAYNAKFAPNPHVWVDNEPGAHMVKRQHTTV